ncbi:MAG: nucleotidyltransferase domain-containing protein [Verrucomicrobiota bacterium]|nr:nucleotidyltransferase domain-containing protein [Verrucomicrobiota bacterium]
MTSSCSQRKHDVNATQNGQFDATVNSEFTSLIERLLTELKAACLNVYGESLVSLAVFGSVGRGTPRPDSDVDLLIVANSLPNGRLRRMESFRAVEGALQPVAAEFESKGLNLILSPVIRLPAEITAGSPLLLDLVDDARVLYDPNRFLCNTLADLRRRLDALHARRVWVGNAWWWDLKPDYQPGEVFTI